MNCYVLIGGQSSRMGRSKAEMFLDRIAATAAPAFERVLAVQRHGEPAGSIETIFEPPHEGSAPVFGILRALEHAFEEDCFILATDLPLITTELLVDLRDTFERSGESVLVTRWRGKIQPLCGAYSSGVAPLLQQRVAAGKLDVRGFVAHVAVIVDVLGDELTNVNTPEEAARVK